MSKILEYLAELVTSYKPQSIILELTQMCNHNCLYCYNVWKCPGVKYPDGEIDTPKWKAIIEKLVKAGYLHFSLSGGEPLLRRDIIDIIDTIKNRGASVNLITNGTLLDEKKIKDLIKAGIDLFEITLLSIDRETHNRLVGTDAFDKVVNVIADIKVAGGKVCTVIIGTKINLDKIEETFRLCFAIGADVIMFNRLNIGGSAIKYFNELLPTTTQLNNALSKVDTLKKELGIGVAVSVPIPPCIVDTTKFKNLNFVYCAAGTDSTYLTIDPLGNVRICNHSPAILGNLFERDIIEIRKQAFSSKFVSCIPEFCKGCPYANQCKGCCKAASEQVEGSFEFVDPFVSKIKNK